MASVPGLGPGGGGCGVEVPDELRVAGHGMAGEPDHRPRVRGVPELTWGSEQVTDELVLRERGSA